MIIEIDAFNSIRSQTRLYATTKSDSSSESLFLPPELEKMVNSLSNVKDDKLRYQQLLFLAQKGKGMDNSLKIDENKVPGCLSVVHVHATSDNNNLVYFEGDSDALLTKGLVNLLVNGLSGCSVDEIEAVNPEFIKVAGVGQTLTPGECSVVVL